MLSWEIYEFFKTTEAGNGGVLWKTVFIKISQYSHENVYVAVSLLAFRPATSRNSNTNVFL